jgi:hypothetical protein
MREMAHEDGDTNCAIRIDYRENKWSLGTPDDI